MSAVAAPTPTGRALEEQDACPFLRRGESRAQTCVASADYDDIELHVAHCTLWYTSVNRPMEPPDCKDR